MRPWWEHGVIYRIYPRSFQDSDADGVGDLAGVEHRLDYIAGLGVDAIWLSSILPSPMADSGHDISDFREIAPALGDMAVFDRLVEAIHARGLKLVLDYPETHAAMMEVPRFWLDRGVDGFRVEIKQPEAGVLSSDFQALINGNEDKLLIGGLFLPHGQPRVHMPSSPQSIENQWDVATLRAAITRHEASPPPFDWPYWLIGGPDASRIAARVGEAQARVAAMLLLTLRGTPCLYQGDELGIGEVVIPADRVHDPLDRRWPALGRDISRTPMPWDGTPFAGFSMAEPWLPLNPDWRWRNVLVQEKDPGSMLALYKSLVALRRARAPLSAGQLILIDAEEEVLAYERRHWDDRLLVALNLGARTRAMPIPPGAGIGETLASTLPSAGRATATLAPNEGRVVRLLGS